MFLNLVEIIRCTIRCDTVILSYCHIDIHMNVNRYVVFVFVLSRTTKSTILPYGMV